MAGKIAFEAQFVPVVWTKMQAGGKNYLLPVKQMNSPGFFIISAKGKKKKNPCKKLKKLITLRWLKD